MDLGLKGKVALIIDTSRFDRFGAESMLRNVGGGDVGVA